MVDNSPNGYAASKKAGVDSVIVWDQKGQSFVDSSKLISWEDDSLLH